MTPEMEWNIEAIQKERAQQKLEDLEMQEGFVPKAAGLAEQAPAWLGFGGAFVFGIILAIMALVFNFMFFVWLLHVEFW